jgi:hypothetical protein
MEHMAAIFISYRRNDSAGHAGRLYDALCAHYGPERVFLDVDDILPGEDFCRKLEDTERKCSALVVVIGKGWLTPRLNEPQDFVRLEIASGLQAKLRIFPVLVQGARMPEQHELPDDLADLAHVQALEIRDDRFQRDAADLVSALGEIAPAAESWAGTWRATVQYNWGAVHEETFKLELDEDELLGTASYLGVARAIQDGKASDRKISFVTKTLTMLGDKTYEEKHSYSGKMTDGKINFRLLTETGYDSRPEDRFIAIRVI